MADVALDLTAIVNGGVADANPIRTAFQALQNAVNDLDVANLSAALAQLLAVPGEIKGYGGNLAPTGYLLCDGTAVSRTTYAGLFAVVGTTFGVGDNSTTFNVPDLRGRAPVGEDLTGVHLSTFRFRGQSAGVDQHVLTVAEMPSHTHATNLGAGAQAAAGTGAPAYSGGAGTSNVNANTGGGGAHNNMSPYQVVNFIIKT